MSDFSSESDSESDNNNENNKQQYEVKDETAVPKFKGYYCNKCGYRTNRLKHFIRHITYRVTL